MGQKVNPIGLRLGIVRGWDSLWYGGKDFAEKLLEDDKIRKYMKKRVPRAGISKILIERTGKKVIIYIHTARPGIVIGKGGSLVDSIKEEIVKLTKKEIHINIIEIKRPELVAHLVAENIANQISNRINFKRAIKFSIDSTMRMGAKGIKVQVAGRLNGAEMARTQFYKEGRTPLHTLRADIDYALVEAQTIYGIIGVKVWICKGEIYDKVDFSPSASMGKKKNNRRGGDRRGGDKRRRRN